jgi:predicted CoA-binding protein
MLVVILYKYEKMRIGDLSIMELKEIMSYKNFVVVGNTLDHSKYAYIIKNNLELNGYNVQAVGKELQSINDVEGDIDILDLCIHPVKGIALLKENKKKIKCVLIQPGAESDEIVNFLKENHIDYLEGCALVGLRMYKNASIIE